MGTIYRAFDEQSGGLVALKLLHISPTHDATERFLREGGMLATVQHPSIVGYVDHGLEEQGFPYLAMEWLEGEDLARRLSRGPLSVEESISLLGATARALSVLHLRGIVHRDLKPSNLFLRNRSIEGVTILDFGLARHGSRELAMTDSGLILGTPEYMAPEQARGERELSAAVDVFSLGCIFYECLTGRSPFRAEHISGILARILFETPASLLQLDRSLPPALDALVGRMLAKSAAQRMSGAASLLLHLGTVPDARPVRTADSDPSLEGVGTRERQVTCSILITRPAATYLDVTQDLCPIAALRPSRDVLRSTLAAFGAQAETLADGSVVAQLSSTDGVIPDLAMRAARCALGVRSVVRGSLISVRLRCTSGPPQRRVGELLNQLDRLPQARTAGSEDIVLDAVIAELLDPRFQLEPADVGLYRLKGLRNEVDVARPLLGASTPCVGRDLELSSLEMQLDQCIEDSASRAVLMLGPPGIGKTRLRLEIQRRTYARMAQRGMQPAVLVGRADAHAEQSSYALISQVVKQLCGLAEDERQEHANALVTQRVSRLAKTGEADARLLPVLRALCLHPAEIEATPMHLGGGKVTQAEAKAAFCRLLKAESEEHAVVLLIDDLQWADSQSVKLLDAALHELAHQPLLVVAWGRPEVRQRFPYLWEGCRQEFQLRGLNRRSSERLVRQVLSRELPAERAARILDQADGSPLLLEALIRDHAAGDPSCAPKTVLAILQGKLGQLPAEVRRVLRAASVFGKTFWLGGVREVLGASVSAEALVSHIAFLITNQLCEERPSSRFPQEREYTFCHALVRDAAYGLLTDSDRSFGHRQAGRYLEGIGERDPQILGEHLLQAAERGAD
jgi:hypothetical protein